MSNSPTFAARNDKLITLDLNFQGAPGAIAAYAFPHEQGVVLVECGPGSTLNSLQKALNGHGYNLTDITDVLLTHIHLDHAGAAGHLARLGTRIHVHPNGAPHLVNPEKLLNSATRIYGEQMDTLWGEFLPVPESQIRVVQENDTLAIENHYFKVINTPGHAKHHYSYLSNGICFTGDIGGVRLFGLPHLQVPMPPPEFHLETWRDSLNRLSNEDIQWLAPTHFGLYSDPSWHLHKLKDELDQIEAWMVANLPGETNIEELTEAFINWTKTRAEIDGINPEQIKVFDYANPAWMSPPGMVRYWHKYRETTV